VKKRKIDETEYLLRSPRNAERLMGALEGSHAIAVDGDVERVNSKITAFFARPKGTPVYYGFKIFHDVVIDGFVFGAITDFESQPSKDGDAFVIAPDSSRAGLVWTVSNEPIFGEVCPIKADRWGVWEVAFPLEMTSRENIRLNLATILPQLKPQWKKWRQEFRN
jgi:hypothetical protein